MHFPSPSTKQLLYSSILLLCLIIFSLIQFFQIVPSAHSSYDITTTTNKPSYHLRQEVNVSGNFTDDGSPVSDVLVAIEMRNPSDYYFAYRTIPIGNPDERWAVNITEAYVTDMADSLIDSVEIDSVAKFWVTVHNTLGNPIDTYVAMTVYDGTLIPLHANRFRVQMSAHDTVTSYFQVYIPEWAHSGKATVYYNVYKDNLPKDNGIPCTPEKPFHFYITRNPEAGLPYSPPTPNYSTPPGKYNTSFKIPPDRYTLPGTYSVYVVGRISLGFPVSTSTEFNVNSFPCPPQACFTYSPLKVYANMTVTFGASSSSAEGYNDTIIRYEWNINDPYNPTHIIKEGSYTNPPSPLAYHTFEHDGTFIVDLNVTDNEGLWSTTSKPIIILPESGPTANFTWSPTTPIINQTVTFDASSSESGWSALTQSFSPIESYVWNFSDGTGNITVTEPVLTHTFTEPANFTVTLTVIDAVDRHDTTWQIVQVLNVTGKVYDVNGDGIVEGRDLFLVARAYGTSPGEPGWNPNADINKDDIIDARDLYAVALHYGEDP